MKKLLLLLPALALAMDFLIPPVLKAQVYGFHITSSSYYADKSIYLTDSPFRADKTVYLAGQCSGTASTDIYLTDSAFYADESWHPTSGPNYTDMSICLSGDIAEWFDKLP